MELKLDETIEGLAECILVDKENSCDFLDEIDDEQSNISKDDVIDFLSTASIGENLSNIFGSKPVQSENFKVQCVNNSGGEGDGAEMFLTFKVTRLIDSAIGYIEYAGRYSSWDSSSYEDYYLVKPEKVMIIQYNKIL